MKGGREGGREGGGGGVRLVIYMELARSVPVNDGSEKEGGREGGREGTYLGLAAVALAPALESLACCFLRRTDSSSSSPEL